jgi:3-hydroxyisobutyrate dehydrogenase-like beta-hydroxyacid dehydrogenase
MSARIGFLGAGHMGSGMVRRLLRAGHEVTVWERTPGRHQALQAEGAAVSADLATLVRDADGSMYAVKHLARVTA